MIYPSMYETKWVSALAAGVVLESEQARLGGSWHEGLVVPAWDAELADLQHHVHARRESDIGDYGATNPADFVAVVTEMFFDAGASSARTTPSSMSAS